jgi:hypothetical protein
VEEFILKTEPNQALERNDHEPSVFNGSGKSVSLLFSLVAVAHF